MATLQDTSVELAGTTDFSVREETNEAMDGVDSTHAPIAEAPTELPAADRPRITTIIGGIPYDIADSGLDPEFVNKLPEELKEEVVMSAVAAIKKHADTAVELVGFDDTSAIEETSQGSDRIQYTMEQLLNMKLDTEKKEPDATANGIREALVEIGVNGPKVAQPKPSVTFASETKDSEGPEDNNGLDENSIPGENEIAVTNTEEEKPKKKKKKRSSGKNKLPPASGFEEFYADPPMTPEEHEEEREHLYNPDLSFVERIENCIQRYRERRKLNAERNNIFTKYMILGGVDAGMKPFSGGLDKNLLETGTREEIARFAATDYVGTNNIKFYDAANPKHWVVDFEGVVKGFLSHKAPRCLGLTTKGKIATCCGVIRNFINYVLLHGVCPEYTQELMNSRMICDKAEEELWTIQVLGDLFPGSFNIACSTLYGGYFKGMHIGEERLFGPSRDELGERAPYVLGMPDNEAERMVKTAIALMGNEEMSKAASAGTIHVVNEETRSFEVVEIIRADPKVKDAYAGAKDINNKPGGMKPLGIMRVKPFDNPDCDEEDCSEDGNEPEITDAVEEFWVEDYILEQCFIGLKMKARVHELNIGLKYFDTINALYCSFFTILPNEKMESYREPTLSTRSGPTVDNPGIQEEEGDDMQEPDFGDEDGAAENSS